MEAKLRDNRGSTSVFSDDVTEVVKKLSSGKVPGIDEIHLEMVKTLGFEGLSWMIHYFNIAWKSGAVPKEWQTGVVVQPVQKGGPESLWQLQRHHVA